MEIMPFSDKSKDVIKKTVAIQSATAPTGGQKSAPFTPARLNILSGAVRSAKTFSTIMAFYISLVSSQPTGYPCCIIGKTRDTASRNILNVLKELAGDAYKVKTKLAGIDSTFELNGHLVYVFGANNEEAEERIRGATFYLALADEVSTYPQTLFLQLLARLSLPNSRVWCTTNPDGPNHWFYTQYIKNSQLYSGEHPSARYWQFRLDDNLSLSPQYIRDLKALYSPNPVWYARMIDGEWVAAEGLVYDCFNPDKHTLTIDKIRSTYKSDLLTAQYVVGMDYGTSSVMSWTLVACIPRRLTQEDLKNIQRGIPVLKYKCIVLKEMYYDARIHRKQKSDFEFGSEFELWWADLKYELPFVPIRPHKIYIDPSASSWKAELSNRGYQVFDADNDVLNGIRLVTSGLSQELIMFSKECVSHLEEITMYCWDPKKTEKGEDAVLKTNDHAMDSMRYAINTFNSYGLGGVY